MAYSAKEKVSPWEDPYFPENLLNYETNIIPVNWFKVAGKVFRNGMV